MTLFAPTYDVCYQFRISRVAKGNFKNLWKLEVKTDGDRDNWVEVTDADMLSTVLSKVGFIFEQDGF